MKTNRLLLLLLAGLLSACGQQFDSSDNTAQPERSSQTGFRTEVIHSPHRGMGKIPISHKVPSTLQVDIPGTVQIEFNTAPNQLIAVEYRPSEDFLITGGAAVDVTSDADGYVSFSVELTANKPGKTYLKLFVYSLDGSMASSTAVPLNIADQQGQIPQQQVEVKERIDLPAGSF